MADDKKIIVDEDWKTRVAAEREELERRQAEPGDAASAPAPASAPQSGAAEHPHPAMPPASFEMLVTTLVTEAMIGLGQISHPLTDELHRDVEQARYAIDMLEMLAVKTKGNLAANEDRYLRDVLHQLRMAFVAVSALPQSAGPTDEPPAPLIAE
jgi:Domain of unknown function (DUF1844)